VLHAARLALFGSCSLMLVLVLAACSEPRDPSSDGDDEGEASEDEASEGEGETGEPSPALGDACESRAVIVEAPTTITLGLRDASPQPEPQTLAAACPGLSGPLVYVEVHVDGRVDLSVAARGRGFTPQFAVLLPGCSADPSRVLACGSALPVTLDDIGPNVDLLVAIGASADEPALTSERPGPDQPDPLDLELRLEVRPVLAEHARCGPGFGRCEPGTVCLVPDGPEDGPEDGSGMAIARCWRPPADSCVAPGTAIVASPGDELVIEIPGDEPHSDAHEHGCTGWRRPERVERLLLPTGLSETASVHIEADDPRVGLALRGPTCAPEHALACAPATGEGTTTSLSFAGPGELAALAAAGEGPLLFIELPSPELDPEPSPTIRVRVWLVD
jgi:hypothetical protein